MKDEEFKALDHQFSPQSVATRGSMVSKGYKPDITVRDSAGRLTLILESEQETDRKAFIGDLIKAERFAESQDATPGLVIVMQPQVNTTTTQIADHLRPYACWLASKNNGRLHLAYIQIISDTDYLASISAKEPIDSEPFKGRGHVIRTANNGTPVANLDLLEHCFLAPPNNRPRNPAANRLLVPLEGTGFEARAFNALLQHRELLGITDIYRCNAARVDGYITTVQGETILLEMKESLRWGSTEAAGFQFLAGRRLLNLPATRGIIVFERASREWEETLPHGVWGQLALEADTVREDIQIGALQITENGEPRTFFIQ